MASKAQHVSMCKSALLYEEAIYGHVEAMRLLLDEGAQINWVNVDGNTPLYIVVKNASQMLAYHCSDMTICNRYIEAVKLLLRYNADVNLANNQGETPLLAAAWQGNVELIRLLLQSYAKVNQANKREQSPLFVAAAGGHVEAVTVLLVNGADIAQMDRDANTPLAIAATYGHRVVVELLEKVKELLKESRPIIPTTYFFEVDKSPVNAVCPRDSDTSNDSDDSDDLSDNPIFHYNRRHSSVF